jgi:acyl-coenzyme A thioesterase PaaI-like protein
MALYHYYINSQGIITHEGIIIDDTTLIELIYKNMDYNRTGSFPEASFYARIGNEEIYLHKEDTPIVWKYIDGDRICMTNKISYPFSIRDLRYSKDGNLYHRSSMGEWGRMSARLLVDLRDNIQPWGPHYIYSDDFHSRVIEPLEKNDTVFLHPRSDNQCFGCGELNHQGLHMTFVYDPIAQSVESWFTPPKYLMGSLNIMHGGMVSLLLDETMGKVLSGMNVKAPTGQLNVRFKKPTLIEQELYLKGRLLSEQGRKFTLMAELIDKEGNVTAQGEGLFIKRKENHS